MWVVKLGGSLYRADPLREWLAVLSRSRSLVVVPGGGPFADTVRQAQQRWGFDDPSAHIMALLAMEQFGRMICGLQPGLVPAADLDQIDQALARGETPVWMPAAMAMADTAIEQSWEVTSDSLAAWLCGEIGAQRLILVKSVDLPGNRRPVESLAGAGIVDAQFRRYLNRPGLQAWILGRNDHARLADMLEGGAGRALSVEV